MYHDIIIHSFEVFKWCLNEISFREKWNIFSAVYCQSLITVYMKYPEKNFLAVILTEIFTFWVHYPKIKLHRTSHRKCSVKKGVIRNFTKFTGKYLCQRLFFNKIEGLRPATLFKKRLCHRCFPLNIVKFLRTPFCIEHFWWLLLIIVPWLSERKHLRMRILHKNQDRRSKVQNNVNFITFCPPWN